MTDGSRLPPFPVWADGRLHPAGSFVVSADDSAYRSGLGCYTSALVRGGDVRHLDRHIARLRRAAKALGFAVPSDTAVREAFRGLARAAFDGRDGAIRMQLSRDASGTRLVGIPRALGNDPVRWRAITSPIAHPGPSRFPGQKLTNRVEIEGAAEAAQAEGVEEALLFDRQGRLVEGTRSNLVLEDGQGHWLTPPAERGGVAGLALEILRERSAIHERDLGPRDLASARGVCVTNAVRGARALGALDGTPLPAGGDALAARLADLLDRV
ncbi:MAG: aminotransferase class IV [Myxococcota bacterium]